MKRTLGVLSVILLVLGMAGCDLNLLNKDTLYFYSLKESGKPHPTKH